MEEINLVAVVILLTNPTMADVAISKKTLVGAL